MLRHYNNTRSIASYFYLVIYMYCYLLKGKFQTKKNAEDAEIDITRSWSILIYYKYSSNKLYLNLYVQFFPINVILPFSFFVIILSNSVYLQLTFFFLKVLLPPFMNRHIFFCDRKLTKCVKRSIPLRYRTDHSLSRVVVPATLHNITQQERQLWIENGN